VLQVVRPVIAETTSLGAAFAAGLAVGFWSRCEHWTRSAVLCLASVSRVRVVCPIDFVSFEELKELWKVDGTWEPVRSLFDDCLHLLVSA
jgi:glycerol kinase